MKFVSLHLQKTHLEEIPIFMINSGSFALILMLKTYIISLFKFKCLFSLRSQIFRIEMSCMKFVIIKYINPHFLIFNRF